MTSFMEFMIIPESGIQTDLPWVCPLGDPDLNTFTQHAQCYHQPCLSECVIQMMMCYYTELLKGMQFVCTFLAVVQIN